jgi:hypothetical protein
MNKRNEIPFHRLSYRQFLLVSLGLHPAPDEELIILPMKQCLFYPREFREFFANSWRRQVKIFSARCSPAQSRSLVHTKREVEGRGVGTTIICRVKGFSTEVAE